MIVTVECLLRAIASPLPFRPVGRDWHGAEVITPRFRAPLVDLGEKGVYSS